MNFDDLPNSWAVIKLGDIFQFNYGKSLVKSDRSEGQYCVYGSNGVIGNHVEYLVNRPCLIIGRKGSIGEIHYSENPCWPIDTTYYVHEFYDQPVKYWFYQFKSLNLFELDRATAIPGLNRNDSYEIKIALPPLNEQKRIVEKIELIQERTRKVKSELDNIKVKLKRLRRSLLASAFRGDLTKDWRADHPDIESATVLLERIKKERREKWEQAELEKMRVKGITPKDDKWKSKYSEPQSVKNIDDLPSIPDEWCWVRFSTVSDIKQNSISSGPFGSALGKKDYQENGVPVIRGKNIQEGKFILDDFVYISETKASELARSSAYPDDLLIVAVGSSGQVALVPDNLPFAILSQNCNKFTLNKETVIPKFSLFLFQSYIIKSQLREKTTDTVRQFLSLTNLKDIAIPLPCLEEQKEIVRKLEKMMQFADRVEEQVKQAEEKLDKFNQSVLAKAFRGKLVPQDPNDEPASVLLGKIQQEKNSTTSKKIKK